MNNFSLAVITLCFRASCFKMAISSKITPYSPAISAPRRKMNSLLTRWGCEVIIAGDLYPSTIADFCQNTMACELQPFERRVPHSSDSFLELPLVYRTVMDNVTFSQDTSSPLCGDPRMSPVYGSRHLYSGATRNPRCVK